ncbi:MAG: hypothetical protein V2J24_23730 [Pseudomonadales bacterium]|jgi:hypothetical protein|nr:hypothetical protein [Pseudomonadales bacterium]
MIDLTSTSRSGIARILNRMAADDACVRIDSPSGTVKGRIDAAHYCTRSELLHVWLITGPDEVTLCEEQDGAPFRITEIDMGAPA